MNRPLRHPQEATSAVSLPWTAVVEPLMGLWEPIILPEGDPATWNSPGIARAYASGRRGARDIFIGYSQTPPSVERIREVANPPPTPCPPVSFDLGSACPDRIGTDAWRC